MRNKSKIIVALEVGTTKTVAIVGEIRADDSIKVLGMGKVPTAGVRKGEIVDFEMAADCIYNALLQAEERAEVEIEAVYLAVTGGHIRSFTSRGETTITGHESEVCEDDLAAVLEATVLPPPAPEASWRAMMDRLADVGVKAYRGVVREHPQFVEYFRQATPEQELGRLPLGSRPAKRREGGVESLRAIPWIFAWTQTRLMLPAWLGWEQALGQALAGGDAELLKNMREQWPFFRTRIDMLEMVLTKADANIAALYDERLVEPALQPLGAQLRDLLSQACAAVLELTGQSHLLAHNPETLESISVRNTYLDPLHLLQAELLARCRQREQAPESPLEQALLVSVAGIAAGLRNTG